MAALRRVGRAALLLVLGVFVLANAGGVARAGIQVDVPQVDAVPELGAGSITCAAALLTFGTLLVTSRRR